MRKNYRVNRWWRQPDALVTPEPAYFVTIEEARDFALDFHNLVGGHGSSAIDHSAMVYRLPERGPALKVLEYTPAT